MNTLGSVGKAHILDGHTAHFSVQVFMLLWASTGLDSGPPTSSQVRIFLKKQGQFSKEKKNPFIPPIDSERLFILAKISVQTLMSLS